MEETPQEEALFQLLDKGVGLVRQQRGDSYLEALVHVAESFFQGEVLIEATPEQSAALEEVISRYTQAKYELEQVRRAFQFAVLKGLKEAGLPPGAMLTPDAVAIFVAHLAQLFYFFEERTPRAILDLACGAGNLVTCVLNHIDAPKESIGLEADPLLLRLAYVNANLQKHALRLYRQDALKPVFFDRVDLVVCDLPVGIYPDDENARRFELYQENEESKSHHLFIEQAVHLADEGAYLFFIIPNQLFTEQGAARLRTLITRETYIQALLELPENLFPAGGQRKSIFVLQKKGGEVGPPQQALLTRLPSFRKREQLAHLWLQVRDWLKENKAESKS